MANGSNRISSAFIIGLFVIIGSALIIGALIWLGSNQFMKEQVLYATYFDGSVEGLEPGSAVKYLGVPCGRVKEVNVAPDGKLVEVVMQMDPNVQISDSIRAKSEFAGIAGGKFIQLHVPTDPTLSGMYPHLGFKPKYKIIKSAPSGFDEITFAARDVLNNLMKLNTGGISDELVRFLGSSSDVIERPEIVKILANLDKSMQRMSSILAKADTSSIIARLSATTDKLYKTTDNLETITTSLNRQINDMQLPSYVDKVYTTYDSTMVNINRLLSIVGYRTENMIWGMTETLQEARSTGKELRRTLRGISDNPSAVFFSTPPKQEK